MSVVRPFIPKDDNAIPDCYGMTLTNIHSGKVEQFEVVRHGILEHGTLIEIVTFEDTFHLRPVLDIKIDFDKRFSQVVAMKAKLMKQKTGGQH